MQKPSEFFQKLEAEQAALGFEVFVGDDVSAAGDNCELLENFDPRQFDEWEIKRKGSILFVGSIYRRPIPAPAPFVDLPLVWRNHGPVVRVSRDSATVIDAATPGLMHVVDGQRYWLDSYVFADDETLTTPCDCGRLATAARFYMEVQP
jgi:hypothetical protein